MRTIALAVFVALFVWADRASAQIGLEPGVFATGGGMLSNGIYAAAGTLGQAVLGRSFGATFAVSAGFWGDGAVILNVEGPAPIEIPDVFALRQNYPNPFNPSTQIVFDIPRNKGQKAEASHVRLVVYDLLGREVTMLANEEKAPGSYTVRFNARGLATGTYLYRLHARSLRPAGGGTGDFVKTRRMMLVR